MPDNSMTVTFPGGKRVNAEYNGFEVATDQSPEHGGNGTEPEPFDLFLASLATCAGVYVLSFCQNRDLPHQNISLTQSWDRDEKSGLLTEVRIAISVPPEFPDKYHDALVRVANKCTVKKVMQSPPEFVVETKVNS